MIPIETMTFFVQKINIIFNTCSSWERRRGIYGKFGQECTIEAFNTLILFIGLCIWGEKIQLAGLQALACKKGCALKYFNDIVWNKISYVF